MKNITEYTHLLTKQYLDKTKICVDMTLGNGYDTLFLAKNCKHVFAYEIQKQGILNSQKLLKENNINNVTIFNESHENIKNLNEDYQIVMFNLGYLPGSDKTITTNYKTTIKAIKEVLNKDSIELISLTIYPGHPEGELESIEILKFLKTIPKNFRITKLENINTKRKSPYLLLIRKIY